MQLDEFARLYKTLSESRISWSQFEEIIDLLCEKHSISIVKSGREGIDTSWDRRGTDIPVLSKAIRLTKGCAASLCLWAIQD